MKPEELIASRRVLIADGSLRRQVPTAVVYGQAPLEPLADLVDELNEPGRLLPGLVAEVDHLILRAAARALEDHPHLRNLLLPGGAGHEVGQVVACIHLDGPGSAAFGLVTEPGGGELERSVQEQDAAGQDGRLKHEDDVRQALRQRRTRPVKDRLLVDGLGEGLAWLRDRVRLPPAWIRVAVQQTGNLAAHLLGHLGIPMASPTMTGPRLVQLVVGAPEVCLASGGGQGQAVVPIGVAFDQRLFEPWEAAAYLGDIIDQLAQPRERLA